MCVYAHLDVRLVERVLCGVEEPLCGPVDVAEHGEQARLLQRAAEQPRVLQVIQRDRPVPLVAQMQEVEVLRDDGVRRAREVERERVFDGAEVAVGERESDACIGLPRHRAY